MFQCSEILVREIYCDVIKENENMMRQGWNLIIYLVFDALFGKHLSIVRIYKSLLQISKISMSDSNLNNQQGSPQNACQNNAGQSQPAINPQVYTQQQTPNFPQIYKSEQQQVPAMDIEHPKEGEPSNQNFQDQYQRSLYEEQQPLNQLKAYNQKIDILKEKQQLLKCSLASHQEEVKQLFHKLYQKKKQLLNLVIQKCNNPTIQVDIGVKEELEELVSTIKKQEDKIFALNSEIQRIGISGLDNDKDTMMLKKMSEDLEAEIECASKFASTQYVRDYLEKTHIYKVSYEDVRYEYQTKIRLKGQLQAEKSLYDTKKDQLNKTIQIQAKKYQELQAQRDRLLRIVRENAAKTGK